MDLEEEKRVYNIDDCITFRKTAEKFGGLSNMASGYPLVVNNIYIKSSEALYQAMRFPNLPDVQKAIIKESSPMTAKMISKKYRAKTREDWEEIKIPIMKWVLRVKLIQNQETFGRLLHETGIQSIVEESAKDAFWGAKVIDGGLLEGLNILGRLLMELRELYKNFDMQIIVPLKIENFKLYGNPIQEVSLNEKKNFKSEDSLF